MFRCSNQQDTDQKYLSLNFEIKSETKDIVNTELITSRLDLGLSRSGNGLGLDKVLKSRDVMVLVLEKNQSPC